jgi:hypothetical protein
MGALATRVPYLLLVGAFLFSLGVSTSAEQPPSVPPLITQRVDETKRTVLQGNTHPLARPQFDRGAAPPDVPMNRMLLVLKRSPAQEHALLGLLDDQQDKASPNYHQWLTPQNFGKQFGPADQDIQAVTTWLQSHGFQIGKVAKGKNIIEFSGIASQVQEAFHTAIHKYVVNGEEHWANASDPEIPTALTPVVAGVHTLHNFLKKPMIHVAEQKMRAQLVTGKDGKPHVTFPGTPPVYGLGPADFATIYNVNPLYQSIPAINGAGQTIGVVGRSNFSKDLDDVDQFFGIFDEVSAHYQVTLNGTDPGDLGGGEEAEATLDVTWSASVAPGSLVNFVVSATTNTTDGVDLSEAYIVDNNLSEVMTESFGSCEASQTSTEAQGYATLAEQAAAQGVTYLVASGDSGPEGCDDPDVETVATGPLSVSVLAATPFNLAVGGTVLNENGQESKYWNSTNNTENLGSALSYIPEDVWNESCLSSQCGENAGIWASGGGASTLFAKPSWQSGVAGIPNDGWRDVPDVSLTAAAEHDPYLLCLEGSCIPDSEGFIEFALVGGTSASTPAFAGIMALVDQKMGGPQGQAGYVLYKLAAAEKLSSCNASNTTGLPASTCIFNDVTVGNNAVPGEKNYGESDAQYQSGAGYDLATGLGSVNATNLVNQWNTVTFTATTTTLSLTPTSITHGQSVAVSAAVAPKSGTGTPTGDIALVIVNTPGGHQGLGAFTLNGGSVSSTINSLPGGSYSVIARYGGDGTFGSSTSAPTPAITVNAESSVTAVSAMTLNSSFNFIPFTGGPYGAFVYLRADVTGQSGNGVPSGNLNFMDTDGFIPGNSFALNSQGNTATPNFLNNPIGGQPTGLFTLAPGAHSIKGMYLGDSSFNASTSSPVDFTITQAPTTTSFLSSNPQLQGTVLNAIVNTNSGGNPPTGMVTFFINGTAVGSAPADSSALAVISPSGALQGASSIFGYSDATLANGSYTVKAVYQGDTNYLSSTSSPAKITLQSDFFLSPSPDVLGITAPGSSGSLTLTVGALDGYTGTIAFSASSCSGLPAGAACAFSPSSVAGGGTTTLSITTTAASSAVLKPGSTPRPALWATLGVAWLAGLIWIGLPSEKRRSLNLLVVLFCALTITGAGCGGGSGSSPAPTPPPPPAPTPTPAGSYNVTVTATSGSLKHNVGLTLVVE